MNKSSSGNRFSCYSQKCISY